MFPLAILMLFISNVRHHVPQAAQCRDGSVFSAVSLHELKAPERLYQKLGCKLAVGMPFKDIASSDTLFMRELPVKSDLPARTALRRLQEVGMHVIVPAAHLFDNPMAGAIPLVPLAKAASTELPEGSKRCAPTNLARLDCCDGVHLLGKRKYPWLGGRSSIDSLMGLISRSCIPDIESIVYLSPITDHAIPT
jgi:hypothetical protein